MKYKYILFIVFFLCGLFVFSQKNDIQKLMQQYRYVDAVRLLEQQPETKENLLLKAEIYKQLYDYSSAIATYEKLLTQNPSDLKIIISLAEVSAQSGDADASFKYWTQANDLSPHNLFLQTKEAIAHYHAGDWKGAITASNKVLAQDSLPLFLRIVGDAYRNTKDEILANLYYTKALEKDPTDYLSLSHICNYYYAMQDAGYDTVIVMTQNYLNNVSSI